MKRLAVMFAAVLAGCGNPTPPPSPSIPIVPPLPVRTAPKIGTRSISLAWNPSPSVEVAGYFIYQGGAPRTYTNHLDAGTNLTLTIAGLAYGHYYWTATAYSTNALESDYSNEVSWPPAPRTNRIVTVTTNGFTFSLTNPPGMRFWTNRSAAISIRYE